MELFINYLDDDVDNTEAFGLENMLRDPHIAEEIQRRDDGVVSTEVLEYLVAGEYIANLLFYSETMIPGAIDAAEKHFSKAIELGYNGIDVFDIRGDIRLESGDFKGASEDYSRCLSCIDIDTIDDKTKVFVAGVCNKLGTAFLRNNEPEKALSSIEKAVDISGDKVQLDFVISLAEAYNHNKKYQAAIDTLKRYRVDDFGLSEYEKVLYLKTASNANYRLKNFDEALTQVNRLLDLSDEADWITPYVKASNCYLRALIKEGIIKETENIHGFTMGDVGSDALVYYKVRPEDKEVRNFYLSTFN